MHPNLDTYDGITTMIASKLCDTVTAPLHAIRWNPSSKVDLLYNPISKHTLSLSLHQNSCLRRISWTILPTRSTVARDMHRSTRGRQVELGLIGWDEVRNWQRRLRKGRRDVRSATQSTSFWMRRSLWWSIKTPTSNHAKQGFVLTEAESLTKFFECRPPARPSKDSRGKKAGHAFVV